MTKLLDAQIYSRRRAMNMSQYVLANKIGLSRNCIQQMECHEHVPKTTTVLDIMKALNFDADERRDFLMEYSSAYYQDKEFQKKFEKELAGMI